MSSINLQVVTLEYGATRLFNSISLTVERGEKVALVGRNGSGKSTLLKLIDGTEVPDSGTVAIQKGLRCARLLQTVTQDNEGTAFDVVLSGLREDGSEKRYEASKMISELGLDGAQAFNSLSAGLKRQTLLGKALVGEPDILLLDEPTNHMDIDAIKRLEETVARFTGTLIFVTHDRAFLRRIATRIVEIDRGRLFDQTCDYDTFLARRSAALEQEETHNALFDKKLAAEEQWVRKGIKARTSRNEGRVRELENMRDLRASRRERPGSVKMEAHDADRSGKLVVKADNIHFSYGDGPIISDLSTTITKGDKIGILGPNGSGKTTLLRILLGELSPTTGNVRVGANLQVSYFDQMLERLDESKTVIENVSDGEDTVTINGRTRHIIGYLQDFLFSAEDAGTRVSLLSGGERNRLMLARLFTRPSNLMVLDEPTNDLDIETLDLVEELLMEYSGTLLLISHDRAFINNVVTGTIVFEGAGVVNEYVGGYDDWLRQRPREQKPAKIAAVKKQRVQARAPRTKPKMKFRDERELESLPRTIELLEKEQKNLYQAMADPGLYKKEKSEILAVNERHEAVSKRLIETYARWEELEQIKNEAVAPI